MAPSKQSQNEMRVSAPKLHELNPYHEPLGWSFRYHQEPHLKRTCNFFGSSPPKKTWNFLTTRPNYSNNSMFLFCKFIGNCNSSPLEDAHLSAFPNLQLKPARRCRSSVASVEDVSPNATTEHGRPWTSGQAPFRARGKLLVLGKCNHHLVNIVQLVAKCVYIYINWFLMV